jgi:hypothetical protein
MSEIPDSVAKLHAEKTIEWQGKNAELQEQVETLTRERDTAKAEVAACLTFLRTELSWEYFRTELFFKPDEEEKRKSSADNARLISNYLKETGHGIAFLKEHMDLQAEINRLTRRKGLDDLARAEMEEGIYDKVPLGQSANPGPAVSKDYLWEVAEDKLHSGDFRVECIGMDGEIYTTIFIGPDAENRAQAFAARHNSQPVCNPPEGASCT